MSYQRSGKMDAVREFFVRNPDEELTYAQMQEKFDLRERYAREIVKDLKDEGFLESLHVIRNKTKGRAA